MKDRYVSSKKKSPAFEKKLVIVKNFKNRAIKVANKETISIIQEKESHVKNVMKNLNHLTFTARRMEAENLVTTCIYERGRCIELVKKNLKFVQDKVEYCLT